MSLRVERSAADITARVINFQRMSTEDGPGIRTTVFFKGCSLACTWCHNPESLSTKSEVVWHDWKCIACDSCDQVCPELALRHTDGHVYIDRSRCSAGTSCTDACPATALERIGTERTVDDVVNDLAKDAEFFTASGGGITASGGEPGLQARFVTALFRRCREIGIHTALDTSGMCAPAVMMDMARETDLVLYDLKEIDSDRHREFTGHPNERILANLLLVAEQIRMGPRPSALWVRTPVIPGCTATTANIREIGAFIAKNLADVVERWELCAFNNLATDKYQRLDREWPFAGTQLLTAEEIGVLETIACASGVRPDIVVVSGRVRVECDREDAAA